MWLTRASFLILALGMSCLPMTADADCTEKQVKKLHDKGMSVEKIADRCDMDEGDVQDVVDESSDPSDSAGARRNFPVSEGAFCCDVFGNSRCIMAVGPSPIGSSCICPGQGYGVICR